MAITKRHYRNKKKKVTFYQAEFFLKGVRVASRSFSKKKEAVLWMREIKHSSFIAPKTEMSFKKCLDQFFEDAKTRLTPSSFYTYSCQAQYLYQSFLASYKMSEIKGAQVVHWLVWLRKRKTSSNPRRKTFFAELKLLGIVLSWYKNYINEDFNIPITKKHKQMCVYKKVAPRPMNYFIKPSDSRKWVRWLRKNRAPVYWKLALFMLSTGVRVGEACGLKWDDIDFEQGTARLTQKVRWNFSENKSLEDHLKTSSERMLIIPRSLKTLLLKMKKNSTSSLVFLNKKKEFLKYSSIQFNFNAGFVALNLPWRSTHICRHTFATIALMTTKNLTAVQASLGHTEPKTTQRYAKIVSLLNSNLGEKTFEGLFKKNFF